VTSHPFVVVEIARGTPPRRAEVIEWLQPLGSLPMATPDVLTGGR